MRVRVQCLPTRVHVIAVNIGAAVAAADAAEGGDGVPVAVAVTARSQRERNNHSAIEKNISRYFRFFFYAGEQFSLHAVTLTALENVSPPLSNPHLYESRLLMVSWPESSCSSPVAMLKHTFLPLRSPFSPSHSAETSLSGLLASVAAAGG